MGELRKTSAFLTINNRHLERNFTFKILHNMNYLQKIASITIKRNYFHASKINVSKDDKCYISLQNNQEDKILVFSGVINTISETLQTIHIEAVFNIVDDKEFNETYKDSSLEDALKNIVNNLEFKAKDNKQEQIILQGKKSHSLGRLLKDKYYFINKDKHLLVCDTIKQDDSKTYQIDDCIYFVKNDCVAIFPIPQLNIGDCVTFQKQEFIVQNIVYHYLGKAQMILGVIENG